MMNVVNNVSKQLPVELLFHAKWFCPGLNLLLVYSDYSSFSSSECISILVNIAVSQLFCFLICGLSNLQNSNFAGSIYPQVRSVYRKAAAKSAVLPLVGR